MNWWSRPSRDVDNPSEKLSLRGHNSTPKWSLPCLIRSRKALAFCTRLVFTTTIFTGFGVIFASVWFMLDCRENFKSVQALIPGHSSFCTNLGMQALFACCVLLFTIFGLGCIGRRMTGHAILIISGVAIFQGSMTLVFYQCRAMADDDIVKAVNTTLESCRVQGMTGPPFASVTSRGKLFVPVTADDPATKKRHKRPSNKKYSSLIPTMPETDGKSLQPPRSSTASTSNEIPDAKSQKLKETEMESELQVNTSWHHIIQLGQDLKRKLEYSLKAKAKENTSKAAKIMALPLQTVSCDETTAYFVALSKSRNKDDLKTCQGVCKTYRSFCFGRNVNTDLNPDSIKSIAHNNNNINSLENRGARSAIGNDFRRETLACGDEIAGYVRHFCIYDNRIFTPLSLGTPIFYMFMSFCFIYLAHCDRQIKDDDGIDDVRKRSRSRRSSSRRTTLSSSSVTRGDEEKASRESSGYSASSALRRQLKDDTLAPTNTLPSPAISEVSSNWGGELGLGRDNFLNIESDASPHMSLQSGSARTVETYLGDD